MESVIEKGIRENTAQKISDFMVKQKQDYSFKKKYAAIRAREFYDHPDVNGNVFVSVGGLDSITLFLFLHSIGIKATGVSVSFLEDKSIQKVHKALGIICLPPALKEDGKEWTKSEIIKEFGFPVLSKEIANKIAVLQHPTEKNRTVRHAIITGETGEYGGYQTGSRMKLSQKWLQKFGGYENETEGTDYEIPDFLVSDKCCYYLKEKPCNDYAKKTGAYPYMGLMASEGGRRQKALMRNGCNYFSKKATRSAPFAIFLRDDLLRLTLEMNDYYHKHWKEFGDEELPTIVPEIYGEIVDTDHGLDTTKAKRTGCSMCGFGVHLEKRPHRFDRLKESNPLEWDYQMFHIGRDINGKEIGWAHVLDYIGVKWD